MYLRSMIGFLYAMLTCAVDPHRGQRYLSDISDCLLMLELTPTGKLRYLAKTDISFGFNGTA
jgi:hypothetical protein